MFILNIKISKMKWRKYNIVIVRVVNGTNSFFRENIFCELINVIIGKGEAICLMHFYVGVWGMRGTKDSCNFIGIGEKIKVESVVAMMSFKWSLFFM